jgi:NAD-dependent dihydropyrimidine dehydrogenase PreA subunit
MPYDAESRKNFKPAVQQYDVSAVLDRVGAYVKGPKAKPVPNVTAERDIYDILVQRLGYPYSVRLRRILEWLFTPFEAEVLHVLKDLPQEEQWKHVADYFDISVSKAKDMLQALFQKGAIFPKDYNTWMGFRFLPRGLYQLHDGGMTNPNIETKYGPTVFNLWNDFALHDEVQRAYRVYKQYDKQGGRDPEDYGRRVLPAYEAILASEDADKMQPWEDARAIIDSMDVIALAPCSCRKRVSGGGMTCKRTKAQVCLNFNKAAIGVLHKHGREITKPEAMQVIRQANRDGLVHSMEHYQTTTPHLLCACCDCCCHHWGPKSQAGWKPEYRFRKSRWEVSISQGACDGCIDEKEGPKCINICQFNSIEMREIKKFEQTNMPEPWADLIQPMKAYVDPELCWGCLSCVLVCPSSAIHAVCVRDEEWVPAQRTAKQPKRKEGIDDIMHTD